MDHRAIAVLDDGCNRACHSIGWAKHAERAYRRSGKSLAELVEIQAQNYKGIGGQRCIGKRATQYCIRLADGPRGHGCPRSFESRGTDPCLHLRLTAHETICVSLHRRAHRCFLMACNQWVKQYSANNTGMHCIWVSEGLDELAPVEPSESPEESAAREQSTRRNRDQIAQENFGSQGAVQPAP